MDELLSSEGASDLKESCHMKKLISRSCRVCSLEHNWTRNTISCNRVAIIVKHCRIWSGVVGADELIFEKKKTFNSHLCCDIDDRAAQRQADLYCTTMVYLIGHIVIIYYDLAAKQVVSFYTWVAWYCVTLIECFFNLYFGISLIGMKLKMALRKNINYRNPWRTKASFSPAIVS